MFAGVIESKSHEGGFLVSFTGSSPALESIIINAETGIYIGKVDAVIGNTNSPLAHVAHIDRKLDLDSLVGINVGIRAKKQREERRERDSDRGQRGNDRGYQSQDRQGGRFERNDRGQDNRNGGDWDCPKCQNNNFAFRTECNRCGEARGAGGGRGPRQDDRRGGNQGYQSRDRQGGRFERNDRGQNNRNGGDWDCPKCRNNNFAFRTECNSCGLPKSGGNDRRGGNDRYGGNDRRGGNDRGRETKVYTDNDWDCPQCNNSNFAFRQECNRCQAPRSGGSGGGGGGRSQRRDDGGRPPRRESGGRPPQRDGRRPPRRDDGGRPPQRDDRSRAPRRDDGGRPPQRDDGARPPRHEGGRPPRRDGRDRRGDGGGYQSGGSYDQGRPPERKSREPRNFRKSQGNGPGHAHNRPPKPLINPDRDD